MISVDAYLFFVWLSQTGPVTLKIQELAFSGCTFLPYSKEIKLESNNQEAFPSAGKNTEIVLVPCHTWECVPTAISGGVDISETDLRCRWLSFVTTDKFSVRVTKIT